MSIFAIFLIFFALSTVIGVPLLSSFQVTQIKGSTFEDWVSGLAAILTPAISIFIVVSLIAYVVNGAMKESDVVIKDFQKSFMTVKDKADQNRQSVLRITNELDKFEI